MSGFRSIAALTLALCLVGPPSLIPAFAQTKATGSGGPTSVASGQIVGYPTQTTTGSNPNGVALTLANTNAAQAFYIRNTGTFAFVAVTLAVSYSAPSGTVTLLRCSQNIAFLTATTCASSSTTSVIAGVVTLSLAAGAWYAFEIDPRNRTTPTISVSISTSQIRAAVTTNS